MFSDWAHRVVLRAWLEESLCVPQKFFEVNVPEVCKVYRGEGDFDYDDGSSGFLSASTALFLRKLNALFIIKSALAESEAELMQTSHHRNVHPNTRNLSKWRCDKCGEMFPTSVLHNRHMHHKHHDATDLKCQYCEFLFTRKDKKVRHERETCPQRPSAPPRQEAQGTKRKRAPPLSPIGGEGRAYLLTARPSIFTRTSCSAGTRAARTPTGTRRRQSCGTTTATHMATSTKPRPKAF